MGDINRSINIYLNEADVEASLGKLQKSAAKLEEQMGKAANPEEFKKLQTQFDATTGKIDTLSKQLSGELNPSMRQMEGAIAKARNELKNMATGTDEFNAKAKKLSEAEAQLKKVREEAFGVGKAITETGKGAGVFSVIKEKVMGLAGSLPGLGEAFTALTGPIGIIAGVIVGFIGLLGQNAEVADKFSYVMGGLKKIIKTLADDLTNLVVNVFGKFKDAIENPKKALQDFGQAIVTNVINHFKALGVIIDAVTTGDFKKLGNGVIQLVTGFTDVVDAVDAYGKHLAKAGAEGYNAAQKLDQLTTQQAQLRQEMAKTQIAIEKNTTAMKNATLGDEERIASAKKVVELEGINAGRRIKSIQLEIDALNEKNRGIKLSNEEEAHLMDLQTQKIQEVANKEAAIRKASNEAQKLEAELLAAKIAGNAAIQIETMAATALKADSIVGDFVKRATEKIDTWQGNLKGFLSEWGGAISAGIQGVNTLMNEGFALSKAKSDNELASEKKNNDERKKHFKALLDSKKITQEQYNKAIENLDTQLNKRQAEEKKKQFMADKAAKIVMTVINTAMSVVNALATMPYPASIVFSALAGAVGAAQIGIIAAQPVPTFALGGVARGASHAAGGISMINADGRKVGEMEGDEPYMILSRDTYRNNGRLIDALLDTSMNRGGARLDLGALPQQPRFNFGGVFENIKTARFASGGVFSNNAQSDLQTALLGQLLDRLNTPIRSEVVYQDITEKGNALNRASSRASFSRT